MVFNTLSVATAVTPSVIETSVSHYLNRKPLHRKPTAHISYHVGLHLVRQFLDYASHHTVEDVQAFTAQWVPSPRWVHLEEIKIATHHIEAATRHIQAQLGPYGLKAVGGLSWWQWRPENKPLAAEWIEMRKDFNVHKQKKENYTRTMLYIHGGAYYFGSVDEHRYQMQRHARKLQARVLAPRYRLAPQYPFPCGLLDCFAAYLYLLTVQPPETIILAGDSAGGGMVVSLLVVLRDQDLPLPAGAILLSPWVDLTHSFPSCAGENTLDYVPSHGFLHRPSMSWPPPNSDDLRTLHGQPVTNGTSTMHTDEEKAQGFSVHGAGNETATADGPLPLPDSDGNLSITIDGKAIEIKDQIQMYATNALLSHPLVSPVLQPSLGGLPPLCIITGGGEMLRDEQIYLAHKAAAPSQYPPSAAALAVQNPGAAEIVNKYPPTYVQLQVWDDMCHVAPTLSFTRPAKFMYRSVAQFGAWALARAQKQDMTIVDDDNISVISSASSSDDTSDTRSDASSQGLFSRMRSPSRGARGGDKEHKAPPTSADAAADRIAKQHQRTSTNTALAGAVGKAGDALPPFSHHMIRQRVTRHGEVFPLEPANSLPACTMDPAEIGVIKPGPVKKWMAAQQEWSRRYAKEKRAVQEQRLHELKSGYASLQKGDVPPPSAIVARRTPAMVRRETEKDQAKRSHGMSLWSGWGSAHDEHALEREEERKNVSRRVVKAWRGTANASVENVNPPPAPPPQVVVVDTAPDEDVGAGAPLIAEMSNQRPAIGGQAFPFKLAAPVAGDVNPSTETLTDAAGVLEPPLGEVTSSPLETSNSAAKAISAEGAQSAQ